mmetsp:Transcript_34314/g.39077  ORF Transcript_34314/g.39077 Transcript_34314/m.39077 type:complete len:270 (+) Transcript_34314:799-1608(+)
MVSNIIIKVKLTVVSIELKWGVLTSLDEKEEFNLVKEELFLNVYQKTSTGDINNGINYEKSQQGKNLLNQDKDHPSPKKSLFSSLFDYTSLIEKCYQDKSDDFWNSIIIEELEQGMDVVNKCEVDCSTHSLDSEKQKNVFSGEEHLVILENEAEKKKDILTPKLNHQSKVNYFGSVVYQEKNDDFIKCEELHSQSIYLSRLTCKLREHQQELLSVTESMNTELATIAKSQNKINASLTNIQSTCAELACESIAMDMKIEELEQNSYYSV